MFSFWKNNKRLRCEMEKIEFLITLLELKGVGRITAVEMYKSFFSPSIEVSDIMKNIEVSFPKFKFLESDILNANNIANRIIEQCNDLEIGIVDFTSPLYPVKLNDLKNKPVLLYYRGKIDRLNSKPSIAIIGTREPSKYGVEITKMYSTYLVENDINIISGLALGIDGIGQESTLNAGGYTVAFIAQGLNTKIYPPDNRQLADRIVLEGGAIISEYKPDEPANRSSFVERDRLQSGASNAVLVIETDVIGGTMHAVKEMVKLGRTIATLDHPEKFRMNNQKSNGNQMLIKEGTAIPVFDKESLKKLVAMIQDSDKSYSRIKEPDSEKLAEKQCVESSIIVKNTNYKNSKKLVSKDQISLLDITDEKK